MMRRPSRGAAPQRPAQLGFTLIEMMIAIAIGLFLVLGVLGIVLTMSSSFRTQDKLTQVQDTQRFVLTVLNNTVHNAGYFVSPVTDTPTSAFPEPASANNDNTTFVASQYVSGTNGSTAKGDTLNVRFQTASGDGIMDCQGNTNTTGANLVYTSSFAVNTSNQLTCRVAVAGAAPSDPVVLADNVIGIEVVYGIDTNSDGSADTYMDAAAVTAGAGLWLKVMSVRVTLTMKDLISSTSTTTTPLQTLVHTITLMNK
jgi:type IV pilus assembly protein PilW